ncbi:MAG TPA: MBL fold metallo-hydrolase [Acidobacteriota bacterium]|nr:MBL fold metallo-hydrolase [Acidobacteriota bacterium]
MGLSFRLLGSGSSGNATLVSDGSRHVLVDVGLSGRETARRLRECGVSPEEISAVIVSHEHTDHCRGVAPFIKDLNIPVFISDDSLEASGMTIPAEKRQSIQSGIPFDVHGLLFTPFAVPHDAADPVGFCIEKSEVKIAVVLDLGYVSNLVIERLKGCDAIVLESNHDVNMLKVGPYPWSLKQRVMSRRGHLSNDLVAGYLASGFDGKARQVVLAHLSKKNNLPELALLSARRALEERSSILSNQTHLELASADIVGRLFVY